VERLREPERPSRSRDTRLPKAPGSGRYAEAALRGELRRVLDAPEGARNDQLNKSAFARGRLISAGMLDRDGTAAVLEDAGQRIGLEAGEIRRSVASGLRAGTGARRG
jgi:hypothetical protein